MPPEIETYTGRISNYLSGMPKFVASVEASVAPLVDATAFLYELSAHFDIDPNWWPTDEVQLPARSGQTMAIGVQLDAVGKWVNLPRRVFIPVPDPWLRLDDETRGLDEGRFQEPYSFEESLEVLDDDAYRRLLKARIMANSWDGTAEDAYRILTSYFDDPLSLIVVDDHTTGDCIYGISGRIPNRVDLELWGGDYLPLATAGVENIRLVTSVDGEPLFGLDVDNEFIGGLDEGAVGVTVDVILNDEL